jgi:hypothetical protein
MKTQEAIPMYRLALAASALGGSQDETGQRRQRLEHLTGTKEPAKIDPFHPNTNGRN